MILVDTSNWIDHLRSPDAQMQALLAADRILCHPFVVGELAVGTFRGRDEIIHSLRQLRQATVATDDEVLRVIGEHKLFGRGIGYIDVHLVTAVLLTAGARLWTRDRRLNEIAETLGVSYTAVP